MLPYVLLIFVPLLFSFVAFSSSFTEYNGKWSLSLGKRREVIDHSAMLPVFFIILIILLSLRDVRIGNDTFNYKGYFDSYSRMSFSEVFFKESDPLYWMLNWFVGQVTHNFQWLLTVVAFLTVIPIAKLYAEERQYGFLKLILFVNMSTFIMLFSGLRQSLAISAGILAYGYVKKKKLFPFLVWALVALGFHHSGFMVFLMYPLYHMTLKKRHLWFVIPGLLLVFIFNQPIFLWATSTMTTLFGDKYDAELQVSNSYTMIIFFVMLLMLAYILPDEKRMDRETIGLRNFLILVVILQFFAPVHTLAMRLNYYYIIFVPVLIPKVLKYARSVDLAGMANAIMSLFFFCYYLISAYVACQGDGGALNTYPYVPFWK